MLVQQRDDSDGSMGSPNEHKPISNITWKTSMKALLYKSAKLQQRSICSNICQIITPLLCVAFTLIVKIITSEVVTSKVEMPTFPRPLDLPIIYELLPFNISCKEIYLYTFDQFLTGNALNKQRNYTQELFTKNLKRYCQQTKSLSPSFVYKDNMNDYMISLLKQAENETYTHGVDMQAPIPDGTYRIHSLTPSTLNTTISVNDYRLGEYHRNNGVTKLSLSLGASIVSYVMTTEGMMTVMEKITRPFLMGMKGMEKEVIFGSYMYMPFDGEDTALIDKTVNIVGAGLYPLGLSLLMPLFLYAIVSEKEEKLIEIMRMNGLKIKYYWICTFIFNFTISMITFTIFYIFGAHILSLSFFTESSPVLLFTILIGWAIAQIGMTTLVQIFLRNAKSATIIGYILSIFSALVGETIAVAVYADPLPMPLWVIAYPPFALCRIIYIMGIACSSSGCYRSILDINKEAVKCIVILYCWIFVFFGSIWLNDQVQQEYGVAQRSRLKMIIMQICVKLKLRKENKCMKPAQSLIQIQMQNQDSNKSKQNIDNSVFAMKQTVSSIPIHEKNLLIKQLSKKYETSNGREDYVALKPFSLTIEQNEIFGLLGPNGAGKTTLISVLTGMYPKTSGNAWINGVQVSMGEANEYIGVCPQFDILWRQLTVYEHLRFYAMLKGVSSNMLDAKIQESLGDVDLTQWKNTPSRQLSGGMQRRLSIAIALVGNPSVVFLDQPSSGLDPSHRRRMWNILKKCKNKTSIILTTHLMQQAEQLCDRIGILTKGQLRCIGKTQTLKQSFGQGYRLHLSFTNLLHSAQHSQLISQLQQKFNAKIVNKLDTRVVLKIEKKHVLEAVRWVKGKEREGQGQGVNWVVGQASLYDVFMSFVE